MPTDLGESPQDSGEVRSIVALALAEDIGPGDETTRAVVPATVEAVGTIVARSTGVLSGMETARETARQVDAGVAFEARRVDGERVAPGDAIAVLRGPARSLLTLERTLLNFLQRLSGVATLTARFVAAVEGTGVAIADTRKTTPGLRFLEKAAVRHGGGVNHRFGLYDACMIKDNHIVAAGGITAAVEAMRRGFDERGRDLRLTVEVRTTEEAREAARLGVDQILLDNLDPESIREAVAAIRAVEDGMAEWARRAGVRAEPRRATIEVSGGITLESVRAKALPGVDLISVGALTHSAPALDLAFDLSLRSAPDHASDPGKAPTEARDR
jgi:nicotinate-nucleotide pyrophosphorylase (carboxylating)